MAAPTTIDDLPDDMLHEIFERVISFADETRRPLLYTHQPPKGAHLALRRVCRRWRDIADWVRLSTSCILVDTRKLADAGAVRARHPAAFKSLVLASSMDAHPPSVARAAASLFNSSPTLRRVLLDLELQTCCLPALSAAVTPVASCTALTRLCLFWHAHENEQAVSSNMLAPLSALRVLKMMTYGHGTVNRDGALPASVLLAPLPALPDAPRLTYVCLNTAGNFVPVGSDAALGRLHRLSLRHQAPVQELVDAEDPFLLRAAFEAGTWQPSRLTGLQKLRLTLRPVRDAPAPLRPSPTGSIPGSEWASLASQVTEIDLNVESGGFQHPSTGIVAGLGVLTALRSLSVRAKDTVDASLLELVYLDRVRAPHLMKLSSNCVIAPVDVAQFPKLVYLYLNSVSHQPPLNLRSLVARSSLQILKLFVPHSSQVFINLAELFVEGGGWPVLKRLKLKNGMLEWDATGLAGAPTAAEFADRARQLLPALVNVTIRARHDRSALPDPSHVGFVEACRQHVVPALLGLHAGGE